jgi:hypothetical protein
MAKVVKMEVCSECDNQLPYALAGCLLTLGRELTGKSNEIKYQGDISDFGNEIGYQIGHIIKNMSESQISDFIHGLKHGISLTNGTH